MGSQGKGKYLNFHFKSRQITRWRHKRNFNKSIRRQRILNKWSIGLIKNLFRLFLEHWPYEKSIFIVMLQVSELFVNFKIRWSIVLPVSHEYMKEGHELYQNYCTWNAGSSIAPLSIAFSGTSLSTFLTSLLLETFLLDSDDSISSRTEMFGTSESTRRRRGCPIWLLIKAFDSAFSALALLFTTYNIILEVSHLYCYTPWSLGRSIRLLFFAFSTLFAILYCIAENFCLFEGLEEDPPAQVSSTASSVDANTVDISSWTSINFLQNFDNPSVPK